MYIMHFVEQWENANNQAIEVAAENRHNCINAYLDRCAMGRERTCEILTFSRLLFIDEDFTCIMQALNDHIVYCYWNIR